MQRKNILISAVTVLFILVILFCSVETVMSQNKTDSKNRQYYDAMEEEYRSNIEQTLDEKGFENSGVNIRWTSNGDGTRVYTVIINHYGINMLNDCGRAELLHELSGFEFADENNSFYYEFLNF